MKKSYLSIIIFMIIITGLTILTACSNENPQELEINNNIVSSDDLIGTWVSPSADNQVMEITADKITFNYRKFDYTVNESELELYQTFPNKGGVSGSMPFKLSGDHLTIELGSNFEGYFYGRSGTVELVKQ